jgi:hypothetical protein
MRTDNSAKAALGKRWWLVALVLAALVGLGYAWYDLRFPSWQEEVLLPDGRTILVTQRRDHIQGYGTRKTWLSFSLPEVGGERTWAENLMPVVIAAQEGKVYVIGMPNGPKQYSMYGGPRFFLVAFVWSGSSFDRIPLADVPETLRRTENVLRCLPTVERGFVTWADKTAKWCESATSEGSYERTLDYKKLEGLSRSYARMDGHTNFSD